MEKGKKSLISKDIICNRVKNVFDAAKNFDKQEQHGLDLIFNAKFYESGYDPSAPQKTMNFLEQINQSLTLLTTYFMEAQHLGAFFQDSLGAKNGTDLEIYSSECDEPDYIYEIFAATSPYKNNSKLFHDLKTVAQRPKGKNRFVFFCSPEKFNFRRKKNKDISIIWTNPIEDNIKPFETYFCNVTYFDSKTQQIKTGEHIGVIWLPPAMLQHWASFIKANDYKEIPLPFDPDGYSICDGLV